MRFGAWRFAIQSPGRGVAFVVAAPEVADRAAVAPPPVLDEPIVDALHEPCCPDEPLAREPAVAPFVAPAAPEPAVPAIFGST